MVKVSLRSSFRVLVKEPCFYLIVIPFGIYVGFFNALSSLLNQVLSPYGFSEDEAGTFPLRMCLMLDSLSDADTWE